MAIHKLRALEYLVAVIEHGGFAAAGRRLGVSAPSIHRLVTALERELGLPLLDRSRTPIRPTPDAVRYVDRARQLVGELQGLDMSLRDRADAPAGTVSVAAQGVAIQFFLAPMLAAFHERYPDIRIDLRDVGVQRDLTQLDADLLVTFGWPPAQDSMLRTLAQTRWLVLAAPAFWERHGRPRHPADLAHLPCVLFRTPYGEVIRTWTFVRGRERVDVAVDGWLCGDHRSALDAPAFAGQAVVRVNDLTATDALRDGTLEPVLLDWVGQHSPPLNVLIRKSVSRQPRVRALIDFMAEIARHKAGARLPAGLPPVATAQKPEWFRRRVG